jgi:hypothetical protein
MSSTIYMYISVHKKNPIKIGEGKNQYGGKINTYLVFRGENSVYTHFSGWEISVYTHFSGGKLSIYSFFRGEK